jgi:hypothetical protein
MYNDFVDKVRFGIKSRYLIVTRRILYTVKHVEIRTALTTFF